MHCQVGYAFARVVSYQVNCVNNYHPTLKVALSLAHIIQHGEITQIFLIHLRSTNTASAQIVIV